VSEYEQRNCRERHARSKALAYNLVRLAQYRWIEQNKLANWKIVAIFNL